MVYLSSVIESNRLSPNQNLPWVDLSVLNGSRDKEKFFEIKVHQKQSLHGKSNSIIIIYIKDITKQVKEKISLTTLLAKQNRNERQQETSLEATIVQKVRSPITSCIFLLS